jgi:hypothetical protein
MAGCEILLTRCHQDGRKDWYRSGLGLVLFRLVVPPFHPGAVGTYLVRGAWLPSHLPGHNRWPVVLRVLDPNSSP